MAEQPPEPDEQTAQPVFLQRCRMDPRWASTQIDSLRRAIVLLVQQIDMPGNDDRTLKTFRGGTVMDRARKVSREIEAEAASTAALAQARKTPTA